MILVDIYVPSLDTVYDFQVDENTPIRAVTAEISEMLHKKVKGQADGKKRPFALCSFERQQILPDEYTLRMCAVTNGSRLLLV